jgi:hypothetical protein
MIVASRTCVDAIRQIEREEKAHFLRRVATAKFTPSLRDKEGARFEQEYGSLLSRNLRDFSKVPDLKVEDWSV